MTNTPPPDGDASEARSYAPLVLNVDAAATRLGLSASTLAKMRLYGTGPAYSKLGRRVVYRPEDLEAWVAANRFQSTSQYPIKPAERAHDR